jgi:hypothetical protein
LAFGEYSSESIAKEIFKKIKIAGFSPDKSGVRIAMLAVLFGQGEVLVIVIVTVIVVFLLLRRRKR